MDAWVVVSERHIDISSSKRKFQSDTTKGVELGPIVALHLFYISPGSYELPAGSLIMTAFDNGVRSCPHII